MPLFTIAQNVEVDTISKGSTENSIHIETVLNNKTEEILISSIQYVFGSTSGYAGSEFLHFWSGFVMWGQCSDYDAQRSICTYKEELLIIIYLSGASGFSTLVVKLLGNDYKDYTCKTWPTFGLSLASASIAYVLNFKRINSDWHFFAANRIPISLAAGLGSVIGFYSFKKEKNKREVSRHSVQISPLGISMAYRF